LAASVPARYRSLIHVLYGGLRWGEAATLRRYQCDLDTGRLIIAESLADVNGRAVFGRTKTYRVRKTRIPGFLVEEFRAHLETIESAPDALLFAAPRGGPLRIANFRRRVWWPALEAAGLPRSVRSHDLRHTCREPIDPRRRAPATAIKRNG
jgi:integrase